MVALRSVFLMLLVLFFDLGYSQKNSPCQQFFTYQYDGITGQYYGAIDVPSPLPATALKLEIVMTVKAVLPDVSDKIQVF